MEMLSWLFKGDESKTIQISKLSQNKILCIADDINCLFNGSVNGIQLPQLVVVGTQSSGKSSVLNGIISMDILPTGEDMVTRIPLNVQLTKIEISKSSFVEFWDNNSTLPKFIKKISITSPNPTINEIKEIKDTIESETIRIAGSEKNISTQLLNMKIFSPLVPNLSFTDLPGLVMMSREDKGQTSDIKDKIEQLALKYLTNKKTIVLAIMQSRADLETDIGLALIKKYATSDTKIIGVLTKPDLMNIGTHIGRYLCNDISDTFKLNNGYFAVRCRSNSERKEMSIYDGFTMEKEYFNNHIEYKKNIYQDRLGIGNLVNTITNVLITDIRTDLPIIFNKLVNLEKDADNHLEKLGDKLPETKDGKLSALNKYVSELSQVVSKSLIHDDSIYKIGVKFKDTFLNYRNDIENIHPFKTNPEIYNDKYFINLVKGFEGNHMSCSVSPIRVLEHCIQDNNTKPLKLLVHPSLKCVDSVCSLMNDLMKKILEDTTFSKYTDLASLVKRLFQDEFIHTLNRRTKDKILELISHEQSYIWTEDNEFREFLKNFSSTNDYVELSELYYNTPKGMLKHMVPKIIMNKIVHITSTELNGYLYDNIINKNKVDLIQEDSKLSDKRTYYMNIKKKINFIKKEMVN